MSTPQRLDWRSVPLAGRVLIEASAGTGKTWTIAQLYLRLLLERGAAVDAILVCTFSEAAAQELRERLRARLRDTERLLARWPASADAAAAEPALHDWLQSLVVDDAHARKLCARLRAARLDFDRAPISTIHAFFGRALREHPFASGAPFAGGELVDEGALLAECFDDFRRRCLQAPADARPAYADLLLRDADATLARVRRLFLHPEAPHRVPDAGAADAMEQAIAALAAPGTAAALRAAVADADGCFGWSKRGAFPARMLLLADWLDAGEDLRRLPKSICDALSAESLAKARAKAAADCSADPLIARVLAGIAALAARERILGARLLEDAFAHCRQAIAVLTRARGQRTFASLIDELVAAIDGDGGAALADALHAAYPHALIDEFQDTDRRQFRVFERIYANGRGSLHLIGDPKQAIYGFRGGDVAAYLHAAASVGEHAFSIDTNRRSAPVYVGALNALYGCVTQPFAHPAIAYVPVGAAGPVDGLQLQVGDEQVAALQLHLDVADAGADDDDDQSPARSSKRERTDAALEACAELVVALLDGRHRIGARALHPADIAVLLPANRHVAQLRRRLSARGVPASGAGRSSVFCTDLAAELSVLLHAILHADDEAAVRAALSTQLLGYDSAGLRALDADPQHWDSLAMRFEDWRSRWREHGVLALVEALQRGVAARTLQEEDGERRLTDLRHLGELLAEGSQHCYGPTEQLAWFNHTRDTALADPGATDDVRQLRVESEGARVKVMTLHASKGLQFNVVLLPLAWSDGVARVDSRLACFHDADGQVVFDLGTEALAEGARAESTEQLQERLRLLYVGLTRAVHACHVFWSASAPAANALRHLVDGVLARHGGDSDSALEAFASATAGVAAPREWRSGLSRYRPAAAAAVPRHARTDLPALRPLHWTHSFSALTRRIGDGLGSALGVAGGAADENGAALALSLDGADSGTPPDPRLQVLAALRGPRFGNALHRVFELFDSAEDEDGLLTLIAQCLHDEHIALPPALAGNGLRRIAELVRRSRAHDLGGGLRLGALPADAQVAEFEFHFPLDHARLEALRAVCARHGEPALVPASIGHGRLDGLMTGLVDLVLQFDGRFHVLDYKSNWLGDRLTDYAPAALQQAMEHAHYPLQALLYTLALHRYLRQRIPGYAYDTHMGEALYLFVRAVGLGGDAGVWRHRFPRALIDAVDAVFDGHPAGAAPARGPRVLA